MFLIFMIIIKFNYQEETRLIGFIILIGSLDLMSLLQTSKFAFAVWKYCCS